MRHEDDNRRQDSGLGSFFARFNQSGPQRPCASKDESQTKQEYIDRARGGLSNRVELARKEPRPIYRAAAGAGDPAGQIDATSSNDGRCREAEAKVLIVDANPICRRLASLAALGTGWTPHSASSVAEALGALRGGDFSLVLLDCYLPDGHGIEIVEFVGSARFGKAIRPRVAAISSDDDAVNIRRMLDAGAEHYFVKPVAIRELMSLLTEIRVGRDIPESPEDR